MTTRSLKHKIYILQMNFDFRSGHNMCALQGGGIVSNACLQEIIELYQETLSNHQSSWKSYYQKTKKIKGCIKNFKNKNEMNAVIRAAMKYNKPPEIDKNQLNKEVGKIITKHLCVPKTLLMLPK